MTDYNHGKPHRRLWKNSKVKMALLLFAVFFAGKVIDLSVNFSADKPYNPATFKVAVNIAGFKYRGGRAK